MEKKEGFRKREGNWDGKDGPTFLLDLCEGITTLEQRKKDLRKLSKTSVVEAPKWKLGIAINKTDHQRGLWEAASVDKFST